MTFHIPTPHDTADVVAGDGAIIRLRRYARPDALRLFLSNGNGFAIDGYYPFWGPLADRFELVVFDVRNHGQNPLATSGRDGHTYAQMTLDLERVVRAVAAQFGRRRSVGVFHSMSARTAMKHAIEIGFPWDALILFDPPTVPPRGHAWYEAMDVFEHRLADWAMQRPDAFADPSALARQYAETRAHSNWVPGAHELMARAVLREEDGGYVLACPRELEASIYLQAMTLNLWPRSNDYGGPVKLIAADPDAKGAPAPAFANRALAEEGGYSYDAIPGTGHLLQIQKPDECRAAMLKFLADRGIA
ncbi:MAG: alpha/beta hydrolase [Candidatus Rokubacteria bacterium]|nr:alpha/beta hydrolase [Candidatus Rokubacteria bacterium]